MPQAQPQKFDEILADLTEHLKSQDHDEDSINFVVEILKAANEIPESECSNTSAQLLNLRKSIPGCFNLNSEIAEIDN